MNARDIELICNDQEDTMLSISSLPPYRTSNLYEFIFSRKYKNQLWYTFLHAMEQAHENMDLEELNESFNESQQGLLMLLWCSSYVLLFFYSLFGILNIVKKALFISIWLFYNWI